MCEERGFWKAGGVEGNWNWPLGQLRLDADTGENEGGKQRQQRQQEHNFRSLTNTPPF